MTVVTGKYKFMESYVGSKLLTYTW